MLQVMKLVVFCAVAFACVAPLLPAVQGGEQVIATMILEAVAVPVVWAGLSLVLVRRGEFRDRLVTILLLVSVSVALGFACVGFVVITIASLRNPTMEGDLIFLLGDLLVTLALAAAACFLASRLLKRRATEATSSVETPELDLERTP